MIEYEDFKYKFYNYDEFDSFIDYFNSIDNEDLCLIIRKTLGNRYIDPSFYLNLRENIEKKSKKLKGKSKTILNLLFVYDQDSIVKDLKETYSYTSGESLISILLAGRLQHYTNSIEIFYSEVKSKISSYLKNKLYQYFLSRKYSNDKLNNLFTESEKINKYKKDNIRVALCISGQVRGIETAIKSWVKAFNLNKNNNVFIDIFISTWSDAVEIKKLNWGRLGDKSFSEKLKEKYKEVPEDIILDDLKKFLPPKKITEDYLLKAIGKHIHFNHIEYDIEDESNYPNYTNPMKLYYKIHKCFEMTKKKGIYDLYIRIRPDLVISEVELNLIDIELELSINKNILASYAYVYEYYGFGVDDKLAISKFDNMDIYSKTWIWDKNEEREMKGHINLANNLMSHKIEVRPITNIKTNFANYNI
ncbi:hypothetical protein [Pasteurella multocida]|uniref:hypothetical protein n=1 Tax=Pasteurella multocida TaxID=747 RepID=UPI002022137D|nr:hypothetical protein [Pasteurella multocida]MCL7798876.1 hypothetical protein [Pasteurella multocida]MCL7805067.1 hypothetical protein [Pasteurella multocida]MCL7808325.1 hypothetical protein [Pasteurella multocida]MCL7809792.1 hypothetical protein [Pasteurella multocida]MCL7813259.1 hypothetical protein [Pasteurella multocida]